MESNEVLKPGSIEFARGQEVSFFEGAHFGIGSTGNHQGKTLYMQARSARPPPF